jgi:hypothetical protein
MSKNNKLVKPNELNIKRATAINKLAMMLRLKTLKLTKVLIFRQTTAVEIIKIKTSAITVIPAAAQ